MAVGLVDGLPGLFGSIFAPLYSDGIILHTAFNPDGQGGGSSTETPEACKVQVDTYNEAYRAAAGFAASDVRMIILASGVSRVTTNDSVTVNGATYAVASVVQDPARTYYECRGIFITGT